VLARCKPGLLLDPEKSPESRKAGLLGADLRAARLAAAALMPKDEELVRYPPGDAAPEELPRRPMEAAGVGGAPDLAR